MYENACVYAYVDGVPMKPLLQIEQDRALTHLTGDTSSQNQVEKVEKEK